MINRHSIDAKLDCPDWVLATVAENAMTAYANIREIERKPDVSDTCNCPACQLRRALDGREPVAKKKPKFEPGGIVRNEDCDNCPAKDICPERWANQYKVAPERKRDYRKPEAFDVPKEVEAMAEFFGDMFPGSKVEIHRVEMPRRNPRDKRRGKNKRNGGNNGKR